MSRTSEDTRLTLLYATREMAAAAMRRAGQAPLGTAEHDFYVGVTAAAHAHQHHGRAPADHPGWLQRQTAAFREGYLKASAVISAAVTDPRLNLLVPTFETTPAVDDRS